MANIAGLVDEYFPRITVECCEFLDDDSEPGYDPASLSLILPRELLVKYRAAAGGTGSGFDKRFPDGEEFILNTGLLTKLRNYREPVEGNIPLHEALEYLSAGIYCRYEQTADPDSVCLHIEER